MVDKKCLLASVSACALVANICITQVNASYFDAQWTPDPKKPFGLFIFSEDITRQDKRSTATGKIKLQKVTHNKGDLVNRTTRYTTFEDLYQSFSKPQEDKYLNALKHYETTEDDGKTVFTDKSNFAMMIDAIPSNTDVDLEEQLVVSGRKAQLGIDDLNTNITLNLKSGIKVADGGMLVIMNDQYAQNMSNMNLKIVLGDSIVVEKDSSLLLQSVDSLKSVSEGTGGIPTKRNTVIAPKNKPAIVVNGGTLNVSHQSFERAEGENSSEPLIQVKCGNVNFEPSSPQSSDGTLKFSKHQSASEKFNLELNNGNSKAPAISVEKNASVTIKTGNLTASGEGAIFELSDGATINLEGGSIISASEAPAITVDSGATIIIPEDSKAEIKSEGGNVAVDLAGGSKVKQGNNAITVASDKDDSASNYVDNYGNLVLQNGSDDGTVAPNTVIQPNGTTITGNDTLPNVNDDGSVSIPTGGATVTNPEGEKVEVGSGEMPTIVIGVKDQSGHVETSKTIDLNSGPLTLETVVFGNPIDLEKYTCNVASDKSNIANATLNNDHKIVVTPVSVGEAVITATYTNNDTKASLKATFNVKVTTTSSGGGGGGGGSSSGGDSTSGTQFVKNAVYRAYNPNSGEHFYTPNYDEFKYITSIGWNDEGIACMTETKTNGHTLYRLYNPNSGLHHYTLDENEKNVLVSLGWNDEDVAWYTSKNTNDPAVYRLYNLNDGQHHYTMDVKERDALVKLGWTYEGVGYHTSPIKK